MMHDARAIDRPELEADLCIVGGGAAGITIASCFAGTNIRVILLESGGNAIDSETEQLNANATVSGLAYPLIASRLRFLGGTTNHWTGHCYPFLERDFNARDDIPNTGWPIQIKDVRPYMEQASKLALFRSKAPDWRPETWRTALGTKAWPVDPEKFATRMTFIAPVDEATATRSFAKYLGPIRDAQNIRIVSYANVTELTGTLGSKVVETARVKTLSGRDFRVRAKVFVLAAGGVENPRLLLASKQMTANGLGNSSDQVGRYFTDHVVIYQRLVRRQEASVDRLMAFNDYPGLTRTVAHFTLSEKVLKAEGMDDVFVRLTPVYDILAPGADAARRVQDNLSPDRIGRISSSDIALALSRPGEVARWGIKRAYCETDPLNYVAAIRLEPRPVADSRITLTGNKDALGMPIINLHWALAEEGKRSIRRGIELFGQEVGRIGVGRIQASFRESAPWPEFPELDIGYHHTGTTRMSDNPRSGVIDRNCRVHDSGNVYIAGSSAFPTSGSGSPTMMLTALALRLADHLKRTEFV